MALGKVRRLVFVFAAVALFLATVLPGVGANMIGSFHSTTTSDGMNCPDCDTSQDSMVGCTQATCIGLAVIADDDCFDVLAMRPVYAIAAVARPDDFVSALSTPPI